MFRKNTFTQSIIIIAQLRKIGVEPEVFDKHNLNSSYY